MVQLAEYLLGQKETMDQPNLFEYQGHLVLLKIMQFSTVPTTASRLAASASSNPMALPEKYHKGVGGGSRTKEVSP